MLKKTWEMHPREDGGKIDRNVSFIADMSLSCT